MTKEKLLQSLIRDGYLKTPSLFEAFKKVDRKEFVPEDVASSAYFNQALPIGFGQTISQPLTVAFLMELLEPKPGEKILDVGSGSGWQAALLSEIVGERGKVITIERVPELVKMAEQNISKFGFIKKGITKIVKGDGSKGYSAEAPFDKIVAAASAKEIPLAWKEQVRIGGYIVAPVGQSIVRLEKKSADDFEKKEFFGFSFVPLVSGESV